MEQLILKDQNGAIIRVYDGVNEIADLLNDKHIKTLKDAGQLSTYLISKYFRTTIGGIDFYHSNVYFDRKGYTAFTFTQL